MHSKPFTGLLHSSIYTLNLPDSVKAEIKKEFFKSGFRTFGTIQE
jgi:hypothetical protein